MKNKRNFLRNGWIQLRYNRRKQIIFALISIAFVVCWIRIESINNLIPYPTILDGANGIFDSVIGFLETMIKAIFPDFSFANISVPNSLIAYILLVITYILSIAILMINPKIKRYSDNFYRADIVNGNKETPIFLHKYPNPNDLKSQIAVFFPNGTDKNMWYKKLDGLSNSFIGKYVNGVEQKGKIFRACLSKTKFTNNPSIVWNNKLLINDDRKIILGKNDFGKNEILDFSLNPHVKIGAETGGGKTTLQKLILAQALQQGDTVLVADLKGVDYTGIWQKLDKCVVVNNIPALHEELFKVMDEFTARKREMHRAGVSDVDKLNKRLKHKKYNRILVVIEEASDVLMPEATRKKHEYADMLEDIERNLTIIAKQGRFANINLFINCQRPDARSINPDINSNLGFRICGKADDILSNIVLNNSEAAERIPSDSKGFFVDGKHHLFQSYYIENEDKILEDCPRKQ